MSALAPGDLSELLSHASRGTITLAMIEADIAAGAPTNEDGTINLLHYCAWLLQEQRRERRPSAPPPG